MTKGVSDFDEIATYKIVRFYFGGSKRVVKRGLTLQEAQAHCNDSETSSSTCSVAKKRRVGSAKWFDGYDDD